MTCQNCDCIVTQTEADAANEVRENYVGDGNNPLTLCGRCAVSLNLADAEDATHAIA